MDLDAVLRPVDDPRWAAFVRAHPDALPFHEPAWAAMLAECYGFRAFALTAGGGSAPISAGLPVLEVRVRPGPPKWVSLPFTDLCPPLVHDLGNAPLAAALDRVRAGFGADRLEVRADLPGAPVARVGGFVTHELDLDRSEAEIHRSFHANQVRRNIVRAERAGVTVRTGRTEADVTRVFYRLHVRTRRRLGVPVQPMRYFQLLWRRVLAPGRGVVLIAEVEGTPVAAGIFLASPAVCVYKYGASDERWWPARPNHLLFWTAIRWAAARGCRTFHFGRSDHGDTGLLEFKSRWGTVARELSYAVLADGPARSDGGGPGVPVLLRSVIRRGPQVVPRAVGRLLYRYTA